MKTFKISDLRFQIVNREFCARVVLVTTLITGIAFIVTAQATPNGPVDAPKKANVRAAEPPAPAAEPFDDAPI